MVGGVYTVDDVIPVLRHVRSFGVDPIGRDVLPRPVLQVQQDWRAAGYPGVRGGVVVLPRAGGGHEPELRRVICEGEFGAAAECGGGRDVEEGGEAAAGGGDLEVLRERSAGAAERGDGRLSGRGNL